MPDFWIGIGVSGVGLAFVSYLFGCWRTLLKNEEQTRAAASADRRDDYERRVRALETHRHTDDVLDIYSKGRLAIIETRLSDLEKLAKGGAARKK